MAVGLWPVTSIWAGAPSAGPFLSSFIQTANHSSGLCCRDTENLLRSTSHRAKELCLAFPLGGSGLGLTAVRLPVPHPCSQHPICLSPALLAEAPGRSSCWPAASGWQSAGHILLESLKTQEGPLQATEDPGPGEVRSPGSGHSLPRTTRQETAANSEHSHEITGQFPSLAARYTPRGPSYPQSPRLCFCLSPSPQPRRSWQLPCPEAHRFFFFFFF